MPSTPSVGWITSPVPRDQQRVLGIDHDHHGLQPPQRPVGPPVLGQLGGGPRHVAGIVLELGLEPLQQGEGVGRGARRSRRAPCRPCSRRILSASAFMTTLPSVTCPSPPMATRAAVADGENGRGAGFHRAASSAGSGPISPKSRAAARGQRGARFQTCPIGWHAQNMDVMGVGGPHPRLRIWPGIQLRSYFRSRYCGPPNSSR